MNDREPDRETLLHGARQSAAAPGSDCVTRVTLERALLELELVHRLEEARLLRMACRLVARCERGDLDDGTALARWRRQCGSTLAAARADGIEPPAALRACARRAPDAWPPARVLAQASLELDDCRAGRRLARR